MTPAPSATATANKGLAPSSPTMSATETPLTMITGPATLILACPGEWPNRPPVGPAWPDSAMHQVTSSRVRIASANSASISGVVPR